MNGRIGIMQGRLSPRPPDRLQAFPHGSWQKEFGIAAHLGFAAIEWILEAPRAEENPLLSAEGRAEIRRVSAASGVAVRSICADYFMVHRLAGDGEVATHKNRRAFLEMLDAAHEIGAERILVPLLETSAVDTPELRAEVRESLAAVAEHAAARGIVLGLEMEIAGPEYRALIDSVGSPAVRAYYDVGNSTAQGFDVATDVLPLLDVLHAVHLKDRRRGGSSVPLGTGDTNFSGFFRVLTRHDFRGDLLLQHFFDGDPEGAARAALATVQALLDEAEVGS
ncbi:MAG TPA: sugar phosphate isomerase/epimerase family protein [Polyangiaceae bacterium]